MSAAGENRPGSWRARARYAAPLLALGVAVVIVALIVTPESGTGLPLDPRSTRPEGTRVLVEVLEGLDRQVTVTTPDTVADGDAPVILLLWDQFGDPTSGDPASDDEPADDPRRAALERRVEAGARLIVTDPTSPLAPEVGGGVPLLGRRLERACRVDALRDTGHVRPFGDAVYEVPPGADGCFDTADGSWLTVQPKGRGEIVATGGATFLTNGGIAGADNAVLAVHLLTPGDTTRVEIVRPVLMTADAGSPNLLDLVGEHVWAALWQVLIGFLVLAAWRARRLGRPLIDQAPVQLASSDLTAAVGALLARHDTRAATLQRVARATGRRLARRLDLPDPVDADTLADHVATRTSLDPTTLRRVLDPPVPADDADLVRATTALSDLEQTLATRLQSTLEETDVR